MTREVLRFAPKPVSIWLLEGVEEWHDTPAAIAPARMLYVWSAGVILSIATSDASVAGCDVTGLS